MITVINKHAFVNITRFTSTSRQWMSGAAIAGECQSRGMREPFVCMVASMAEHEAFAVGRPTDRCQHQPSGTNAAAVHK